MNQGKATTANASSPRHGKIDRRRPPVSQRYGTSVANGISSAIGPLVSPPAPIAAHATTGLSATNATIAAVVNNESVLSKMVVRAEARVSGIVASAIPAI